MSDDNSRAAELTNRDPLYTVDEAAEYLDVSARTVRRELARGSLTGVVLGRRARRIRRSALEDYIARQEDEAFRHGLD